jgi:phosphoglycerate dehydrogenase-like enzyme
MNKIKVLISFEPDEEYLRRFRAISPRLDIQIAGDEPEHQRNLAQAEVLFSYRLRFDPADAPRLKWVQCMGEGVDGLRGTPLFESDVIITNASGVHTVPLAEYAFASMLAFARRLPETLKLQRERKWVRFSEFPGERLWQRTLGIVGYGSIGRHVARIASSFGMRILACKRHPEMRSHKKFSLKGVGDPEGVLPEKIYGADELHDLLAQCDYVVVTLPLTPLTEGVIGEAELRAMKENVYLVNVGRGKVIDESVLIQALRENWIAGAGLDVFAQEPLPADSELYELNNVILTTHIGIMGGDTMEELLMLFCENLRRYVTSESLLNVVDKTAGY